jgi:hypothetical protein
VWEHSITKLRTALRKIDTDPNILQAIITYLTSWRSEQFLKPIRQNQLGQLIALQDTIGKKPFFEGWIHSDWETAQHLYYSAINSQRSGKRWTIALITKLWDVAWDLWDFCNAVYHQITNKASEVDTKALDRQMQDLSHSLTYTGLLTKDCHLTTIPIDRLLLLPRIQKVEWINQVTLAMAQAKKRHFHLRQSRNDYHRRHQRMIQSMQSTLRQWLASM